MMEHNKTNYKYLDGYISENERVLIIKHRKNIEDAIFQYEFENSYFTATPIKQIIQSESMINNKIVLFHEICTQLAFKLLCDWEQISHYYVNLFTRKIKKRVSFIDDPIIKLKYRRDEIPLSRFLQRVAEAILSTSIYNISTQQESFERSLNEFNDAEKSQALSNTIRLIEKKLANYKPQPDHSLKKNNPSDFIENINKGKVKILMILLKNKERVRYLPNGEAFFPTVFEMMVFYFKHKEILTRPICQALRSFYNALLTQIHGDNSDLASTRLSMQNLLTDDAIDISAFITHIHSNKLDRYSIAYFNKIGSWNESELEALWVLITMKTKGIRQAIHIIPDPIIGLDAIRQGFPHPGFYKALQTSS